MDPDRHKKFQAQQRPRVDIMEGAKSKLEINRFQSVNENMCLVECGLDLDCFLMIFLQNHCFFNKQEAQDDLNKTQCNSGIIYFKTSMLVDGLLYILDGKLNAQISGFYTQF